MANINFNEEFKDKGLKRAFGIALFVVVFVIIAVTIITISKINKGEHVKVFSLEYNIPKEHPDTVIKKIFVESKTTLQKPENVKSITTNSVGVVKHYKKNPQLKQTDTNRKVPQATIEAKNILNGNVSGGTVHVGDDYLGGFKQRHVTVNRLSYVLTKIKELCDKNLSIHDVDIFTLPQAEAENFGLELKRKLEDKKFKVSFHSNLTGAKPDIKDFDFIPSIYNSVGIIIQPPTESELKNPDDMM